MPEACAFGLAARGVGSIIGEGAVRLGLGAGLGGALGETKAGEIGVSDIDAGDIDELRTGAGVTN